MIQVKSVYDARSKSDGYRILVESEWPRGVPKGKQAGCDWMRSLGPSANLRGWWTRNPRKNSGFRDRYLAELGHNERDVDRVAAAAQAVRHAHHPEGSRLRRPGGRGDARELPAGALRRGMTVLSRETRRPRR